MPQPRLALALLAALAFGAPAALADPAPGAALELEICRLPGLDSQFAGQEIDVPAGTSFFLLNIGGEDAMPVRGARPQLSVTTTASARIAAADFCARAPIRPPDSAAASAARAAIGNMFLARATGGPAQVTMGPLDSIYGLLQHAGD